ncbi:hypothetical protein FRC01_000651 [Tulasnella sp. 417]|nr:hypothetical protein FRC01_000651 [Tulasnella sp. 417]
MRRDNSVPLISATVGGLAVGFTRSVGVFGLPPKDDRPQCSSIPFPNPLLFSFSLHLVGSSFGRSPQNRDGSTGNTAYALWGLASGHLNRQESSQAFTLFSEYPQISTDIGDREAKASALWGLASVHRARNEHTRAFTLYSECLQIRTDNSDRRGRAEALCGLAHVHRLQNEYSDALVLCSEALEISTNIGDRYFTAFTLQCMADVYRDQHEATALKEAAELRRFTDS